MTNSPYTPRRRSSTLSADMSKHDTNMRRVTVEDAAKLLGLSENAIRKRIERGSLASERIDGTRYVLLDTDMPRHDADMPLEASALISEMRSRIEFLEDELRRKDTILMSLVQRVPELEPAAPPEARESHESVSADGDRGEGQEDGNGPARPRWYRRILGL